MIPHAPVANKNVISTLLKNKKAVAFNNDLTQAWKA
jgi:hypothetical protein